MDRVVGMIPDVFDKIAGYFKKDKKEDIDASDLDKDIDEFEI